MDENIAKVQKGITFLMENSLFLIAGTIAALLMANFNPEMYHHIIHHSQSPEPNLHFIINDVLMCFFFALATKEIWESLLPGGALSTPKKAATPLLATAGGIIGPAIIYLAAAWFFQASDLYRGWAIPCATDIAFSYLVARLVFGKGHPAVPFLLLLAIADDAAGLVILAIAYPTGDMNMITFVSCVGGAILFNLIFLRGIFKTRNFWTYLLIAGPLSWYGFHAGGIHPSLALVPIIPTLPHSTRDVGLFEGTMDLHPHDPLNAFEHWWKNPVELILLLFGFANAGVAFHSIGLATSLVTGGLLIGKPVGIFLFGLFACYVLKLELPKGMDFRDLLVVGVMAGIGFTVALFVAAVAFNIDPALRGDELIAATDRLDSSKMGALFSFLAAVLAVITSIILKVGVFGGKRIS